MEERLAQRCPGKLGARQATCRPLRREARTAEPVTPDLQPQYHAADQCSGTPLATCAAAVQFFRLLPEVLPEDVRPRGGRVCTARAAVLAVSIFAVLGRGERADRRTGSSRRRAHAGFHATTIATRLATSNRGMAPESSLQARLPLSHGQRGPAAVHAAGKQLPKARGQIALAGGVQGSLLSEPSAARCCRGQRVPWTSLSAWPRWVRRRRQTAPERVECRDRISEEKLRRPAVDGCGGPWRALAGVGQASSRRRAGVEICVCGHGADWRADSDRPNRTQERPAREIARSQVPNGRPPALATCHDGQRLTGRGSRTDAHRQALSRTGALTDRRSHGQALSRTAGAQPWPARAHALPSVTLPARSEKEAARVCDGPKPSKTSGRRPRVVSYPWSLTIGIWRSALAQASAPV
ncbi:hypothetical protein P154DRAFT_586259 [Amniculicola lignicola CBS 123094]|uniref:Uncharacterized protein n=1 Tax=Amniculicola lignicola CBS 123094 TaxID=1392246 RepID=A0A6A5WS21_9PLEO|nr:hypothetical protein P154DRAFT_586259 [Amniculicola lignicola CBS 123094]